MRVLLLVVLVAFSTAFKTPKDNQSRPRPSIKTAYSLVQFQTHISSADAKSIVEPLGFALERRVGQYGNIFRLHFTNALPENLDTSFEPAQMKADILDNLKGQIHIPFRSSSLSFMKFFPWWGGEFSRR
jgi:hypothetical protein